MIMKFELKFINCDLEVFVVCYILCMYYI